MKQLELFLLPLDKMLVHLMFTPQHLKTWVERGTVRFNSLAQEHNTMTLARAQIQTTQSGIQYANN